MTMATQQPAHQPYKEHTSRGCTGDSSTMCKEKSSCSRRWPLINVNTLGCVVLVLSMLLCSASVKSAALKTAKPAAGSRGSAAQVHSGHSVARFDLENSLKLANKAAHIPLQAQSATQPPSVLNQSIVDDLRQSLSKLALRLERALAVDRNSLDLSVPPATGELQARIARTSQELAQVNRMQATTRQLEGLSQTCSNHFFSRLSEEFLVIRPLTITTASGLERGHTLSFAFDHQALIDAQLSLVSADDIRIYHQPCLSQDPVEVHRIIEGIGTQESTLHFPVLEHLEADAVFTNRYALVFGNPSAGYPLCDPRTVFRYYEDFVTTEGFMRDWQQQFGIWTARDGLLEGRVASANRNTVAGSSGEEVDIFFKNGTDWMDVEIQMDIQVPNTPSASQSPPKFGPFLRVDQPSISRTTGVFVKYTGSPDTSQLPVSSFQRDTVEEAAVRTLPSPIQQDQWHRVRYVLLGQSLSQWLGGQPVEPAINFDSMARSGTLGLGCNVAVASAAQETECHVLFDNIRVRSVVASEPTLTLPDRPCPDESEIKATLGRVASVAADSCKQIHDLSFQDGTLSTSNGRYFIRTPSGPVETYCDMVEGGWTLVGQVGGTVGTDISKTFLRESVLVSELRTPTITTGTIASLNAVDLAVNQASEILISRGNRLVGIGNRWVRWALPIGRQTSTFWNRALGVSTINSAPLTAVNVESWDNRMQNCFQNQFGVSPKHGAFPATVANTNGDPAANDLCLAIGVEPSSLPIDGDGFAVPLRGFDAPRNNGDWLNAGVGQDGPTVSIWLR
eukprot:scpid22682/ scgid29760/ 